MAVLLGRVDLHSTAGIAGFFLADHLDLIVQLLIFPEKRRLRFDKRFARVSFFHDQFLIIVRMLCFLHKAAEDVTPAEIICDTFSDYFLLMCVSFYQVHF